MLRARRKRSEALFSRGAPKFAWSILWIWVTLHRMNSVSKALDSLRNHQTCSRSHRKQEETPEFWAGPPWKKPRADETPLYQTNETKRLPFPLSYTHTNPAYSTSARHLSPARKFLHAYSLLPKNGETIREKCGACSTFVGLAFWIWDLEVHFPAFAFVCKINTASIMTFVCTEVLNFSHILGSILRKRKPYL